MTSGKVTKTIFIFSLPIILSNILQNLYSILDSVIVGKIMDNTALAAVGCTGSVVNLCISTITGLMTGFSISSGMAFGGKNGGEVKSVFGNSIVITTASGIIFGVLGWFATIPILRILHTPAELMPQATAYLRVMLLGIITTMFYNLFSEIMRSVGDSKKPLIFLIIASVIHIVLLFLLVSLFKMGVIGAALSTVLSQGISVVLCWVYIRAKIPVLTLSVSHIKPDMRVMKNCLRIGLPLALTNFVVALGVIILQFFTNGIGSEYVAVYACASRIGYIMTTPVFGFTSALAVFCSQNYGACSFERIRQGIKNTFVLSYAVSAAIMAAVALCAKPLMVFLLNGDQVGVNAGRTYLFIRGFSMFILIIPSILKNALSALGRPLFPAVSGFVEIASRFAVPILLTKILGFAAVPLTDTISWLIIGLLLIFAYQIEIKKVKTTLLSKEKI